VGSEDGTLGIIAVADPIRENAKQVVQALAGRDVHHLVLLSGDNEEAAAATAQAAGINAFQAGLLPEDKVRAVEGLLSEYGSVAMVGDGVNDAPALARATVGIAMGAAGTDAALETADIVLMSDDLDRIPYVVGLGRRTVATIKQNIALSLLIKGIVLLLAVAGQANLWMAVFADMGTSLIVTLNGMKLLRQQ
jgi:Cd2+/Zn2+-exporting ATPase